MHNFYDVIITALVSVKYTILQLFCSAINRDHDRLTCINRSQILTITDCKLRRHVVQTCPYSKENM